MDAKDTLTTLTEYLRHIDRAIAALERLAKLQNVPIPRGDYDSQSVKPPKRQK